MSSVVFDTLRDKHRDQLDRIHKFEDVVAGVLRAEPAGVLDEMSIANQTDIPLSDVEELLVELCEAGILEMRVFWVCPNGSGVAEEAASVAELPERVECQCGTTHYFDPDDVEVGFIASGRFGALLRIYTARWPLGRLLDELDEVATWLDVNSPREAVTPWLIRRDIVREAITRLQRMPGTDEDVGV